MGTTLSEVADLFLSAISDYKLDAIYTNSGSMVLNTYIEPWLLKGISSFSSACNQPLIYAVVSGSSDGQFTETLTMENQIILSQFMELRWLEKGIQDIRSLNNFIQDRDFKSFSPAQNIKARTDNYNNKKEEISQRLVDYAIDHNIIWSQWRNQIFYT
jgi:hypothetical protein